MNKEIEELQETIRKCEARLCEIRESCQHPSYFIGNWSYRVGQSALSRVCNECMYCLPGITEEEIEKFNSDTKPSYQL